MDVVVPSSDRLRIVLLLLLTIALGCNRDVAPVSGKVTLNGEPLAGAVVTFQPRGTRDAPRPSGTGSVGKTDSQGRFSLRMVEPDRAGAVVGDHIVTISTPVGGSEESPPKENPIPEMWRSGAKTFRVPRSGTAKADFEITATSQPAPNGKKKK